MLRGVGTPDPLRLLIVDDDHDAVELLALALASSGHEIRVATAGAEALAVSREFKPEVALLDVGLPDMDGFELAARIRAIPGLERIRVVGLSGFGLHDQQGRNATAAFDACLVKPARLSAICEAIAGKQDA